MKKYARGPWHDGWVICASLPSSLSSHPSFFHSPLAGSAAAGASGALMPLFLTFGDDDERERWLLWMWLLLLATTVPLIGSARLPTPPPPPSPDGDAGNRLAPTLAACDRGDACGYSGGAPTPLTDFPTAPPLPLPDG